jgi:putative membrane protein
MHRHESTIGGVLRGTVAGMIGGAAASWVMNQFQAAMQKSAPQPAGQEGREQAESSRYAGAEFQADKQRQQDGGDGGDDATVKTAQAISRGFFDHELTPDEKQAAGPAVHYAYGAIAGGLYGGLSELVPAVGAGLGMPYAIMMFALGDEIAVPALKLGPPPTATPPGKHLDYLAAHIVYGVALDVVSRVARHVV